MVPADIIKISRDGHTELDAFLVDRIYEFNAETTGFHDGEVFAAAIRNSAGEAMERLPLLARQVGGCLMR